MSVAKGMARRAGPPDRRGAEPAGLARGRAARPPPRSPAPARGTRTCCAAGAASPRDRGPRPAGEPSPVPSCAPAELIAAFALADAVQPLRAAAAVARLAALRLRDEPAGDDLSRLEPAYLRAPRGVPQAAGAGADMAIGTPLAVDAMRTGDIAAVHEIERLSFSAPWPAYAFEQELRGNRLARYVVARARDRRWRPRGGLRRHVADGRRGAHHHLRRASRLAAAGRRRAAAAAAGRHRARAGGGAHDPGGAGRQSRRPGAVPAFRLHHRRDAGCATTPTTARTPSS